MATTRFVCVTIALFVVGACGGSSTAGTSVVADAGAGAASSDITIYQGLAANTESAATTYRSSMMGSGATAVSCNGIHDQYDAQVRPWVSQMVQMGREMDVFMDGHAGSSYADMRCGSATMMDELDHHRSLACMRPSLADNQAEAARHADAMRSYAAHLRDRCVQMLGNGGGATCCDWRPMMAGCENWSGTCCSSMMWGCCNGGGMMDGHGMMNAHDCCSSDEEWHELQ